MSCVSGQEPVILLPTAGFETWLHDGSQLLTNTSVSALVVAWAALEPPAVVGLHRLPVGCSVGDPERARDQQDALTPRSELDVGGGGAGSYLWRVHL